MAKSPSASQILHEAEAQRQHLRVHLPAAATLLGAQYRVADWSHGGLALEAEGKAFPKEAAVDTVHDLLLEYRFDGFELRLPLQVQVTHRAKDGQKLGCQFHRLSRRQQALVRYFVTAYISGELVDIGDVMDVVARQNAVVTKPLPDPMAGLSAGQKRRRKLSNALRFMLLVGLGLGLCGYVVLSLYQRLFVIEAQSARVVAEALSVDAPAGGKLYYHAMPDDGMVKKGAPLLTVTTANGVSQSADSPCDCVVTRRLLENNRVVRKGAPALELVTPDAVPYVEALVAQGDAVRLKTGQKLRLLLPGQSRYSSGRITAIRAGAEDSTKARLVIAPQKPLPVSAVEGPVEVRIDRLQWF